MTTTGKLWNRYFVALLVVEICVQTASFVTRPITANFAVMLGTTISIGGFIAGVNKLSALALRPVSGMLSDRLPKKNCLIISTSTYVICALGCALAQNAFMLGLFCVLQGIALAFQSTCMIALTVLAVPPDRMGSGVGFVGLVGTLALALGPALGTFISEHWDYATCFWTAVVLYGIGFLVAFFYRSPERPREEAIQVDGAAEQAAASDAVADDVVEQVEPEETGGGSLISRLIDMTFYVPSIPYACAVIFTTATPSIMAALVVTVTEMDYLENGAIYFTIYALVAMTARPIAGRLSDTYGILAVAIPGLIVAAGGMLLLVFFHNTIAVIAAGFFVGLGQASAQCSLQAESVRGVDTEHLGRAANTYYFGADIGGGLAPLVGGVVLEIASPQALFALNASCCLSGLVVILAATAYKRRKSAQKA